MQADLYARYLAVHPRSQIADISFTANTGRTHFDHRLAVLAASPAQLHARLAAFAAGQEVPHLTSAHVAQKARKKVAFLFTGQGSQYLGMARQLFNTQPTFRAALMRCDQILRDYLEQPLLSVLYPATKGASPLDETAYTQPVLFAIEYALVEMWRSWGVEPDSVLGHSVGEYVAACVAGVFSLEDALKLVATRGKLMQTLPANGTMTVVFAEPERLSGTLAPFSAQVSIAALNGPKNTVISGESSALQTITLRLKAEGLATHPMTVSHAFHSPQMDAILDEFERTASEIEFLPLQIPSRQ